MVHGTVCGVPECDCTQSFAELARGRALRTEAVVPVSGDELRDAGVTQVGGDHYLQHSIQPWDIWQEYGLNAFEGAILKYLLRRKNDRVEDLKKARHTLDRLIEIEEAKGGVLRPEGEEAEQRSGRGER